MDKNQKGPHRNSKEAHNTIETPIKMENLNEYCQKRNIYIYIYAIPNPPAIQITVNLVHCR